MVVGPEITISVGEFESSIGSGYHSNNEQHHADYPTAQKISGIRYKDSDRYLLII